jgi:formylglycine-generating enzyme required for sulfatase activity
MGQMQANFVRGRGDFAGIAGSLNDGAFFTTSVFAYAPNDFGLFNMAGNVAEWVLDVYRAQTFEQAHGLNPFRGHIFRTQVRDEDGEVVINEHGRVSMQEMTPEQIGHRRNFQRADARNFGDGDFASVVTHDWLALSEVEGTTAMVYDIGSSLVTDRSRVVKGGSFMDRAFFLHPANRRFLEQDLSEPWIGFRLAMPRIGTPTQGQAQRR